MIPPQLKQRVEPIIRKAGDILLSYFHHRLTWTAKGDGSSFVTEADLASEQFLIQQLQDLFPQASVFAEESGHNGPKSDYCWVIDPLDGTTNFAHGIGYFCISVALTYKNEPVFGMIFDPLHNELFYAEKGKGAFLNGVAIQPSNIPLQKGLIIICFPYGNDIRRGFERLQHIFGKCHGFRIYGAAALDLANVAAGRAEAIFFYGLAWWDVAAGMLILSEAGALVSAWDGGPITPDYKDLLAGNQQVYASLLPYFKD